MKRYRDVFCLQWKRKGRMRFRSTSRYGVMEEVMEQ